MMEFSDMKSAPIVERDLNPLSPNHYTDDAKYRALIEGLHAMGTPIVRSVESVNDDFAVDPQNTFPYDQIGGPGTFITGHGLVGELLHDPRLSSFPTGSGVLPFAQTRDGRRLAELAPDGTDPDTVNDIHRALMFGFLLSTEDEDHHMARKAVTETAELRPRSPEKNRPIDDFIDDLARDTVGEIATHIDCGETVDLNRVASNYTYRVISKIIGIDLSGPDAQEKIEAFVDFSHQAFMIGDPDNPLGATYANQNTLANNMLKETMDLVRNGNDDKGDGKEQTFLDRIRLTDFREQILHPAEVTDELELEKRRKFVEILDLGALIASAELGIEGLTANHIIATRILEVLKPAGAETTATTFVRAIDALLQNREQIRLLEAAAEDQAQMNIAVGEVVRHTSAVNMIARTALTDIEIEPVADADDTEPIVIPAGERVYFVLGAANHDPSVYEDPWELKLDRRDKRHVAYGDGRHGCPGARLANNELSALLREVAKSGILHRIEADGSLVNFSSPQLHGVKKYSVRPKG